MLDSWPSALRAGPRRASAHLEHPDPAYRGCKALVAVLRENMTDEENPVTKARSSYEFIPSSKARRSSSV
jgi:hypothetical protein